MTPFLKLVADDVYKRFNGHLEDVAIVFPNKRAGLFFDRYLLECSNNAPLWSPRYMGVGELFQENSDLAVGDPILLVSKLYKVYIDSMRAGDTTVEIEKSAESLDSFYYWGEMLIKDFDDVDKHLANAKQLFANIKDLREIGTAKDTLDEQQIKSIARFFENFKPESNGKIEGKFQKIWERLFTVYTNFKETLRRGGIAYEGMLYRDVIESDRDIVLDYDKYIFVGFSALNEVETRMFDYINKQGKALFYWDYDNFYINDPTQEAGYFMRKNIAKFPGVFDKEIFNNLRTDKQVTVVETVNDSSSVRYISTWLNKNLTENEIDTAIVLCDETMLEPTLHTIPKKVNEHTIEQMNVTMGFPITHTPVFGLVRLLVDLQTRGWSEKQQSFTMSFVCELLKHPYVVQGSPKSRDLRHKLINEKIFFPGSEVLHQDEFLTALFTRRADNKEWLQSISELIYGIARSQYKKDDSALYDQLFVEAIMKVYTQCQRLVHLLDSGDLDMQQATIGKLLVRTLSSQRLPFHGEPVVGLQIMGLLETRNLDFKHIILLGVNEGNLPKNSGESSYIPYNLRKAFGLTLSEHRDSIYSYYFYRLLQRAEKVTLVYNSSADSKTRGECSRYILQLLGNKLYNIERIALSSQQSTTPVEVKEQEKTREMIEILRNRFDTSYNPNAGTLTPSAINKYIDCGLRFFYYYVMKMKPIEEVDEDFKDNDFGTVFHKAAENLYEKITADGNTTTVTEPTLKYYIDNPGLLYEFIDQAFKTEYFKNNTPVYNGEQYIKRGVMHHFLLRLVKMDAAYTPFQYIASEAKIEMPCNFTSGGNNISVRLGGTIDRVDSKGDTVDVADYKTGGGEKEDANMSLDDIFAHKKKAAGYHLQAFLYSIALRNALMSSSCNACEWVKKISSPDVRKISPQLLYVHHKDSASRKEFVVGLNKTPVEDISVIETEYMNRM
ncbi:MAG: exodeoxyribonuclease V subunit gamma, partial [Bacteroidaceae bacterium]|nr:exodeoxyribonuclease V subunit gamma [Bacteroidaceae bacterium]